MGLRFKSKLQKLALVVIFLLIIFIVFMIIPMAKTHDSKVSNHIHEKSFQMENFLSSDIIGTGSWQLVDGRIFITLKLDGISKAENKPVHLRRGTCESPGPILVSLNSFTNSISETRIALDITHDISKINESMIVSVLKSPNEPDKMVSCGVIEGGFEGVEVQMIH